MAGANAMLAVELSRELYGLALIAGWMIWLVLSGRSTR